MADPDIGDTNSSTLYKKDGEIVFSGHFSDGTSQVLVKSTP
jgi:hypothetical protein